jgi:two-component system, cell cycle sensor histidine kinase and response regulator CckA
LAVEYCAVPIRRNGQQIGRVVSFVDVSARKQAEEALRKTEEQLRQAQKMEAIGQLTAGVAHDFNNILSIILSYSALILDDLGQESQMSQDVLEIRTAGERAADLTRQLLAFSRRQILQPAVVDLNQVLAGMEKMFRRVIGEDIQLNMLPAPEPALANVDPGQFEQVIMNLAVNARDAMPEGGNLSVEISRVELGQSYADDHAGVTPGPHLMVAVTDTGIGMDRQTQARIFEPFFTTKPPGKGTGLGLPTVFGIVRQSGGHIWVYSEPAKGTTFKIYLPPARSEARPALTEPGMARPDSSNGDETILVVEDDERLRKVTRTVLTRHGYRVLEARSGGDALLICEQSADPIHLLLTDVIMPHMAGPELATRLTAVRPRLSVVYMSGYTDNAVLRRRILEKQAAFVQKPFRPEVLLTKVRQVLDEAARAVQR